MTHFHYKNAFYAHQRKHCEIKHAIRHPLCKLAAMPPRHHPPRLKVVCSGKINTYDKGNQPMAS